ncbi:MAG TPA: hypothetical protein VHC22_24455 [Pirellulales bacterium]|nr:hypothetical protein [Pirellulales bacterium]
MIDDNLRKRIDDDVIRPALQSVVNVRGGELDRNIPKAHIFGGVLEFVIEPKTNDAWAIYIKWSEPPHPGRHWAGDVLPGHEFSVNATTNWDDLIEKLSKVAQAQAAEMNKKFGTLHQ